MKMRFINQIILIMHMICILKSAAENQWKRINRVIENGGEYFIDE
jgi:hypothetical protein